MVGIAEVFRVSAIVISVAAAVLLGLAPASAEKRVALIIGNSTYQKVAKLPNPTNDAKAIAGMLRAAGFEAVELHENLGIRELRRAIGEFSDIARDADTAIIYYSGHGVEVNGVNYLIPVDAVLERDIDVPYEAYSLDNLLQMLEPVKRLRLVMLDACRNNPFVRSMKRTVGTRAIGRGLAAIEPTSMNTLIGFAAKAGSYALDGDGANSPYAIAVVNNLATPGLDLRLAFGRVRDEVMKTTKNAQEPFIYGSLGGANVSIVDAPSAPQPQPPTSQMPPTMSSSRADVAQFCREVAINNSIAVVKSLAESYKGTPMAACAEARVDELKKSQVAVVAPPTPPTPPPAPPIQAQPVPPPAPPIQAQPTVGIFPPTSGTQPLSAVQERGLKPKNSFKECDACPEMVLVPSGTFTMGSPASEPDRAEDEGPQHKVTIARPFAAGKFAVTFDEWDACVADGGCNNYRPSDEGWGRGKRPVIHVRWNDAQAYVAWLSRKTGKTYRLLSESEREYVARAGTTTPFWWGSSISTDQANYDGTYTYNDGAKGGFLEKTAPVNSFQPNPWGFYQVHGNVWEWTEDCYQDNYAAEDSDGSASTVGDCKHRVLRGGSWRDNPQDLRSANRLGNPTDYQNYYVGFRVARTLSR